MTVGWARSRLLVIGGAGLARAADPPSDAKQEAKARFISGQSHYNLNEFPEALREFKEGYRLYPDPVFLYNLGQCERQLGHPDEAIRFYRSFLREQPKAPNRQEVLHKIEEMEAALKAKQAEAEKAAPPPPPSNPGAVPPGAAPPAATGKCRAPPPPAVPPATAAAPGARPTAPPAGHPAVTPEAAGGAPDRVDLTASPAPHPRPGRRPSTSAGGSGPPPPRWRSGPASASTPRPRARTGDSISGLGSKKVF